MAINFDVVSILEAVHLKFNLLNMQDICFKFGSEINKENPLLIGV